MSPVWSYFLETPPKFFENQAKFFEILQKAKMREKGGKVIATWNITDKFNQSGQVRLMDDGTVEKKLCGQKLWRLLARVDIGIMGAKDVQESLKATEGIVKVIRQRG